MHTNHKQDSRPISAQDLRDKRHTLNDAELELIAGGVSMQDFHFVMRANKATPKLAE